MDFPSNICIAWFCRSTHLFQTFLVFINGRFCWFWPTLLLYYPEILKFYLVPFKNCNRASSIQIFAILTHTYHRFGLSMVLCDDYCLRQLGTLLLISSHMHSIWIPLILDCLLWYQFLSGVWFSCKEGMKTPVGKPLHLVVTNPCFYYSIFTEAHSLSRIWDHQSVSNWPNTSSLWRCYWYQLILICLNICPIDSSTALCACLKITMGLRRIEPTSGFCFKFASPGGNTDVPHLIFRLIIFITFRFLFLNKFLIYIFFRNKNFKDI